MDFHDFCYETLQMNTNHAGKFTTSRITYVAYLVMLGWRQWNHAVHRRRYSL